MKSDQHWMQKALAEAVKAQSMDEVPVGALMVKDGQCISAEHNQPIQKQDPCAHAEILAIQSACRVMNNYRLPGTTLYVTLEPCMMCVGAMIHARVKRVVFGASDVRSGIFCEISSHKYCYFNHSLEVIGGVLAEQSSQLLKAYFQKKRLVS